MPYATTALRVHQFVGLKAGPALIVLGAVHGSEIAGTRGIERLVNELDAGTLAISRGRLTLVPVTNPFAYQKGERNGDRNLNRNLSPTAFPKDFEDHVANALCPMLAQHDALLDLHSFLSSGEPFVMIGPANNGGSLEPFTLADEEQRLALRLGPRRIVEGWLSTYAIGVQDRLSRTPPTDRAGLLSTDPSYGIGTTEFMRRHGGYAVTLECGQHSDPAAPDVAYCAIRNTLAHLHLTDEPDTPPRGDVEFLRLSQVIDRHHTDDRFVRGWSSFDPVQVGQQIGTRHDGTPVLASTDGYIVFPNSNATKGNEWFYLAQPSTRDIHAASTHKLVS